MSQLSTKFRHQITWNGYPLDLVKSGLQKYIRRGDTNKALYCAGEIDLFKTAGKEGEGIRTNLLNRLLIIYMEDVENLSILDRVNILVSALYTEREKTPSQRSTENEEKWLSELVVLLCHSTKARICSHARSIFNTTYHTPAMMEAYPSIKPLWDEIEENNKDRISKQRSKFPYDCEKFVHYFKRKSILSIYYALQVSQSEEKLDKRIMGSTKPVWFLFNQLSQTTPALTQTMIEWYKKHIAGMKEDYMCWLLPLLSFLGAIPKGEEPVYRLSDFPSNWDRNRSGDILVMNDFVVDRHTQMGRSKSLVEFALVGSHVENEASYVNPLWKAFYQDGKRLEDGQPIIGELTSLEIAFEDDISDEKDEHFTLDTSEEEQKSPPKESEAYSFVVRSQISTSNSKMDVYFATDNVTQQFVVVKGPYKTRKEIDILNGITQWKDAHNLPYVPFIIRSLLPDRWPEGVPLGARNRVDRSVPSYFLVFDSVVDKEQLEIKSHSSKVWPPTEVVDWDKLPLHFDYQTRPLTEQEMKDYTHALLFRYLLGISDLADRNFLMTKGRVISIDEDIEHHMVDLYAELRKNKATMVYEWLRVNYRKLDVNKWTVKDASNDAQQQRMLVIQDYNECLRLFHPGHIPIQEPIVTSSLPKKILRPQVKRTEAPAVPAPAVPVVPVPSPVPVAQDDIKKLENTKSSASTATASRYPAMNDNFVFIDNIYRSRLTLLDILKERGYDVSKYEKFSPAEATAAASSFTGLSFHVSKTDNEQKQCHVRYENISQQKLKGPYFTDLVPDEDCENVEIIMMMSTHVTDTHHGISLKEYMKLKEEPNEKGIKERRKLRVSFFAIEMIVINPLRHVLVPKHELVPEEEHPALMERLYVTSKSKLPEIKFHLDPIARCIGAVPGDIVKITRPSASSGEAIIYRVCAP